MSSAEEAANLAQASCEKSYGVLPAVAAVVERAGRSIHMQSIGCTDWSKTEVVRPSPQSWG
jgi:hypothetical protein